MQGFTTIAVIDIGKTNAKLVLVERASGRAIDSRSTDNAPLVSGPYPHADVERLWAFIIASLGELHRAHGVGAIAITTHGATAALIGEDGLALPVLDYEHDGPEETAGDYAAVRPGFDKTYSPRLPNGLNLGAQIFWQSRRFPEAFARVSAILTYPQYWAWRLSGVAASEMTSLGCHTDLWEPVARGFSSLVGTEGWGKLFPPIRAADSVLGPIRPEIAEASGLDPATPVACGIHDSNASLVAHLDARPAPFTVISSGTWTICMSVGGSTDGLDPERDSLANVDLHGRPVPTARFMGGREFELLGAPGELPSEDEIERVLGGNVHVLPSLVPGVGPFPRSQGGWRAGAEALGPGERAAAVSLYLALVTEAALGLCGVGAEIVVEGPFARNRLYCRALGGLTGVPVLASADATGTSLGASMLLGAAPAGGPAGAERIAPLASARLERYRAAWRARLA